MYKRTESFFTGFQDIQLYYQRWIPQEVRGQLIITHGHGEHSECYHRVTDALKGQGWSIFAWDWRGHGRSHGQRGFAHDFLDYTYDFECFVHHLWKTESLTPKKPLVLLAHSMGALIQLKTLMNHPEWNIHAQVLSGPLLGVSLDVPTHKEFAAHFLKDFFPKLTLASGVQNLHVSQDPEVIKEFERDVLRHSRICAGVYLGSVATMKDVQEKVEKIKTPTLMQISDEDAVVSSSAAQDFFSKLVCEKEIKIYPGFRHEIYNDLKREIPLQDLRLYLNSLAADPH